MDPAQNINPDPICYVRTQENKLLVPVYSQGDFKSLKITDLEFLAPKAYNPNSLQKQIKDIGNEIRKPIEGIFVQRLRPGTSLPGLSASSFRDRRVSQDTTDSKERTFLRPGIRPIKALIHTRRNDGPLTRSQPVTRRSTVLASDSRGQLKRPSSDSNIQNKRVSVKLNPVISIKRPKIVEPSDVICTNRSEKLPSLRDTVKRKSFAPSADDPVMQRLITTAQWNININLLTRSWNYEKMRYNDKFIYAHVAEQLFFATKSRFFEKFPEMFRFPVHKNLLKWLKHSGFNPEGVELQDLYIVRVPDLEFMVGSGLTRRCGVRRCIKRNELIPCIPRAVHLEMVAYAKENFPKQYEPMLVSAMKSIESDETYHPNYTGVMRKYMPQLVSKVNIASYNLKSYSRDPFESDDEVQCIKSDEEAKVVVEKTPQNEPVEVESEPGETPQTVAEKEPEPQPQEMKKFSFDQDTFDSSWNEESIDIATMFVTDNMINETLGFLEHDSAFQNSHFDVMRFPIDSEINLYLQSEGFTPKDLKNSSLVRLEDAQKLMFNDEFGYDPKQNTLKPFMMNEAALVKIKKYITEQKEAFLAAGKKQSEEEVAVPADDENEADVDPLSAEVKVKLEAICVLNDTDEAPSNGQGDEKI